MDDKLTVKTLYVLIIIVKNVQVHTHDSITLKSMLYVTGSAKMCIVRTW